VQANRAGLLLQHQSDASATTLFEHAYLADFDRDDSRVFA
jgi:hypothetical protein